MERYEIRKIETLPDRKAAEDLFRKIFILEKSVFSETSIQKFSHNNDCLVVFFEGHPVAALCFSTDSEAANTDIKCFGVAADFRRQNVGRLLMNEFIDAVRINDIKAVTIDTLAGARPFFLAFRFKEVEKPRIIGNNAFVLMIKDLV